MISCQDESSTDFEYDSSETVIGFSSPFTTKGSVATDIDTFNVFAYYLPNDTWDANKTPAFMYNQEVTKHAGNIWKYSPVKHWPSTGKIRFLLTLRTMVELTVLI